MWRWGLTIWRDYSMNSDRLAEAEPLYRRALVIDEQSLGKDRPKVVGDLSNLAALFQDQGRWAEALSLFLRIKEAVAGASNTGEIAQSFRKANLSQSSIELRILARALHHTSGSVSEGGEAAQWALQNEAAEALSLMASRFAPDNQRLADLIRERQDFLSARERISRALDVAIGKADANAAAAARASTCGRARARRSPTARGAPMRRCRIRLKPLSRA